MRGHAILLFLLLAIALPTRSDDAWDAVSGAQGIYEGRAMSGGVFVPVETRLTVRADGTLEGNYSFFQDGETHHGTLLRGRATGPAQLVFIWHDAWGFGTLTLDFEPDFSGFVGAWGSLDDGALALPWIGVRIEPAD